MTPRLLRRIPWTVVAVLGMQVSFLQWHPAGPNPNELSRIYLTRALVEDGTVSIDRQRATHGDTLDKSVFNGRFFSDKAPGVSLLGVPAFAALRLLGPVDLETSRHLGWLSAVVLPSLLVLLGLWRFLTRMRVRRDDRNLVVVALGGGSLFATYGTLLFSHALTGALLLTSLMLLWGVHRRWSPARHAMLAGLAAGYATITEYPAGVTCALLAGYAAWSLGRAGLARFSVGAAGPALLAMGYHQACFGSPFSTGYQHLAQQYYAGVHNTGFLGIATPTLEAIRQNLFGVTRGLLFFSPWTALALAGVVLMLRSPAVKKEGALLASSFLALFYTVTSFGAWDTGGSLAQRHLTAVVPMLALPFAWLLQQLRRHGPATRGLVVASVVTSVVVTMLSTVPWPYPSSGFGNPLAEVALPFWQRGVLPTTTLETAGLGRWTGVGVFGCLLAACLVAAARAHHHANTRAHWAVPAAAYLVSWAAVGAMASLQIGPGDYAPRQRRQLAPLVDRHIQPPRLASTPEERLELQHTRSSDGDVQGALEALDFTLPATQSAPSPLER